MILCIHLVGAAMPGRWLGQTDRLSDAMRPIRHGVTLANNSQSTGEPLWLSLPTSHATYNIHTDKSPFLLRPRKSPKIPASAAPQLIISPRSKTGPPWFISGIGIGEWCRSSAYLLLNPQRWRSHPFDCSNLTSPDAIFHPSKRSQR